MRLVDRTINIGRYKPEDRWMERREFLKLTLGFTAAAGALVAGAATTAQAAPMLPPQPNMVPPQDMPSAEPAIATQDEVDAITAEQVRWRRRRYRRYYVRPRRRRVYVVRPRRRRRVFYY